MQGLSALSVKVKGMVVLCGGFMSKGTRRGKTKGDNQDAIPVLVFAAVLTQGCH